MDMSLTIDQRAERLTELARASQDQPDPVTDLCLREWAHPALSIEQQREHLTELIEAVNLRDDLEAGWKDWWSVDPELRCPNRNEAALQMQHERVDELLRPLVYGPFTPQRKERTA
jgi:hypothetical protein